LLLLVWLRAWPSPPSPPSRRYPATPGWILRGAIEAHLATLAGGAVLAILAAGLFAVRNLGLGLPAFSSATPYIVAVMLGYGVGLLASALVHELAHYWAARRCGIRMRAVFVRMCVVGLSHESGPPLPTLLVSAAGPLAALVLMGGLCLLILNLPIGPLSERLPVAFACLTIAVQHLPGLTPLTRDGRLIAGAIGKLFLAAASRG
jgi:membrane-associated protease RseP (regulator of RpoE activity)